MDYQTFRDIINGSIQYEVHGTVLTLTGYYTGKRAEIDLAKITPEMLEEITADPDEDEEEW